MYHHSREYGGGCRYALVLELHGFNPDKEPWKGYLKRGDIRVEAGRLADGHETTPEHLKSATIAGLVFEAGLLFPDREFYRSGSWIDSTVDLKDQWYVHERFPDDPLPENIKQAPVWGLFTGCEQIHSRGSTQQEQILRCAPGTKWDQITITLVPSDTENGQPMVRIKTPDHEKLYTHHLLGMYHKQNPGKPTRMWFLLVWFAKDEKIVNITEELKGLIGQKKLLDHHLQNLFGIEDTIYKGHARRCKGHETKIQFRSELYSPVIEPRPRRTTEEPRGAVEEEDRLIDVIDAKSGRGRPAE